MELSTSVDKAIDVLFHLHVTRSPVGVTDLGRALGLPKSSAHRLLAALGRRGLVDRDDRGRYRPGIGLLALGLGVLDAEPIVAAARPVLEAGARDLGETHFLVAARGGRLLVLDKAEGSGFLRASPQVGSSVPAHATAAGKLQLAFAPEDLEPAALEPFTSRTLTDPADLARELERVRTAGYAANRDEWINGLSVVAAPVFHIGALAGCLAVAASTPHMDDLVADQSGRDVAARIREAANAVAARLAGYGAGALEPGGFEPGGLEPRVSRPVRNPR